MVERVLLSLLVALSMILFLGCPGDPVDDDDAADDDAGDDDDTGDDDSGDDDTGDDDTEPPVEPFIEGTVYEVDCTTPIADVRVTWCQDVCMFKNTDANGHFVFDNLDPGEGLFDVVGHVNPGGLLYTGLLAEFEIPATGSLVAPDVCLPEIPADNVVSLPKGSGMQTVDVGDGLTLHIDPDDVEWFMGTPEIGAVEVPESSWGEYVVTDGFDVLGVWAFYAWGNEALTPISAVIPGRGELECDQAVAVLTMGEDDSRDGLMVHNFQPAATATYDCGADEVITDPGQGLTHLTWVAIGVEQ